MNSNYASRRLRHRDDTGVRRQALVACILLLHEIQLVRACATGLSSPRLPTRPECKDLELSRQERYVFALNITLDSPVPYMKEDASFLDTLPVEFFIPCNVPYVVALPLLTAWRIVALRLIKVVTADQWITAAHRTPE